VSIDQRLREASARLRTSLAELPEAEVPRPSARVRLARVAAVAAGLVIISALAAGVVAVVDDRDDPVREQRTTDGGSSDGPEGATTRVPDIVGRPLGEARTLVEGADLELAVEELDAPYTEATVLAAEPGNGLVVPVGSVIGVRTALPDPPESVECPAARHPRGDADPDALPRAASLTRSSAEDAVRSLQTQFPPDGEVYVGAWSRWAYTNDAGRFVTAPTPGFQAIVLRASADECPGAPTFAGAPVTFAFGDPTSWAGERITFLDESVGAAVERIDVGPLAPRGGHSVVWTGDELIVWGGWGDEVGSVKRGDGAAYDPASRTWRMIAASPLTPRRNHAAAWTGAEMVVFGGDGRRDGAAYDPRTDTWRRLPDAPFGIGAYEVREREESHLFAEDGLFIWEAPQDRVARWDASSETWRVLDPTGLVGLRSGALRATRGRLYAVGTTGYTGVPLLITTTDLDGSTRWSRLEDGTFSTSRNIVPTADPHWSAALPDGRVVAWSIGLPDTAIELDPGSGLWSDLPPHNVTSCEGATGPVVMDDRLLVQSCDGGTIYDSTTDAWSSVDIRGAAVEPSTSIWTGAEVISWGATCCYGTAGAPFEPNSATIVRPPP